ncbi:MAG: TolB family protein [Acidimicrobiia bacterium]
MRPLMRQALVSASLLLAVSCREASPLATLLVIHRGVTAVAPDGESQVLLDPEDGAVPSQPTWAPDGTFAVWTEIAADGSSATIAMGNEESQRRIDGGTAPFFYGFSPNGESLAYLGNDPGGGGVALGLLNVAAGTARLVDAGQPYYLDWSPDGSQLAVHANQSDLYLLDEAGNRTDLDAQPGLFQAPAFLTDDRLLIINGENLAVLDIHSSDVRDLATVSRFSAFAPSPNGERVAFIDNSEAAPGALSVVSIEQGEAQRIEDDPVVMFDWSPDGSRLLYLTLTQEGLVPFVWTESETTGGELFLPTRTFFQSYLPFWDQYSRFLTMWRSDGSGYILPRTNGDAAEIAFYPSDGAESQVVAQGEMAVPAP